MVEGLLADFRFRVDLEIGSELLSDSEGIA